MEKKILGLQSSAQKEIVHVTIYTVIGVILMYIGFLVVRYLVPDGVEIPFDYTVILGGICGGFVAILNIYLMFLSVQKIAATDDDKIARGIMKASYSRRMLLQILWMVAVMVAPCFQLVAGILPLLFPSLGIKLMGIISVKKSLKQEVEQKQDGD